MSSSNKYFKGLVKRVIKATKNFTTNSIPQFIYDCEPIFLLKGKREPNFLLDLSSVKQASMLGILTLYKIIEFAIESRCFEGPIVTTSPEFHEALEKYGFANLIYTYISNSENTETEYKKLKLSIKDNFIIAPQALLRNDQISKNSLNKLYFPKIEKHYFGRDKVVSMIFLVFSEVLLNFWEHAITDTKSIIVANGNNNNIEIACADTGDGIIATLGKSLSNHSLKTLEILQQAIQKGVTSKIMTNHMGYGLWILDEIVTRTSGRMHIYTQGAYYHNDSGKKNLENVAIGKVV